MQVRDPFSPSVSAAAPTRRTTVAIIAALVIVIDQITKVWAVAALDDRTIDVVWKLQMRLLYNPGTAFSIGQGFGPVLGVVACIVAIVLARMAFQPRSLVSAVGLALILGGAIGNVIDRLIRAPHGFMTGHVVDFIDFQFWPVFNVSDIGVTCGIILVIFELQEVSRRQARPQRSIDG